MDEQQGTPVQHRELDSVSGDKPLGKGLKNRVYVFI